MPPQPRDTWSKNPYPRNHPKYLEYEAETKREQRTALVNRFKERRGQRAVNLRLTDYAREHLNFERGHLGAKSAEAPSTQNSPQRGAAAEKKGTQSLQPQERQQQSMLQVELTEACSVVVMHGGATLWVSHKDGTISVRNGFTGELKHTIPAYQPPKEDTKEADEGKNNKEKSSSSSTAEDEKEKKEKEQPPPPYYTKLLLFGRYVVACHNEGGLHFYDAFLMVLVGDYTPQLEGESNKPGPILYAEPIAADGVRFYTMDTNGNIVVWDIDEGEPEDPFPLIQQVMAERIYQKLNAAHAYEGNLFLGTTDGHMIKIDLSDLGFVNDFTIKDPKEEEGGGEENPVTAITIAGGLLFAGGKNGKIVVIADYDKPTVNVIAELDKHHAEKSIITHLIPDHRSGTVWSVATDGEAAAWYMSVEQKFAVKHRYVVGKGNVLCADLYCHADSMRLWTLATSGSSYVWLTEFVRTMCDMNDAVAEIQEVIAKEEEEMKEWEERIKKQDYVNLRRKNNCVDNLMRMSDSGMMKVYFAKLLRWRIVQQSTKRRLMMAEIMCGTTDSGLQRLYYMRMLRFAQIRRNEKQKLAIASNCLACTDKGLQRIYFRKLSDYHQWQRRERQKKLFGNLVLRNTDRGVQAIYYRQWVLAMDKMKYQRKRQELAGCMLRGSDRGLQQLYYFKLQRNAKLRKETRKRSELTDSMLRQTDQGIQKVYFLKLRDFIGVAKKKRTRQLWSDTMVRSSEEGLRSHYYSQWMAFEKAAKAAKAQKEIDGRESKIFTLLEQKEAMAPRLEKTEKLKELRKKLDSMKTENDDLQKRQNELLESNATLKKKIEDKKKRDEVDASLRDELTATMHKLKSRAINVASDLNFITKTLEKCKGGAAKAFLSAHMDVKRTVVQVVGEGDNAPKWPLGNSEVEVKKKVARFPNHAQPVIVNAIKTMVITFDILTQKDLDSLGTDEEIVANAEELIAMYETLSTLLARRKPAKA